MRTSSVLFWAVVSAVILYATATNVVGIDFGSEWIKVGMVKAGAGVQIVLTDASKRKASNVLAIDEDFRTWGDVALSKPHLAYQRVRELLGKKYDEDHLKSFPDYYHGFKIQKNEERGTYEVVHQSNSSKTIQPEEITAMVLAFVVDMAAAHAKEKVEDVVITVPSYFTQFERQAMLDAAEIAGVNVLTLLNDHTALALKFGIDHKVENLEKPINVLFYDMGSTATVVSVVNFSSIPDKEAGKNKTQGQFHVKSVAWDTNLGGFALTSIVAKKIIELSGKGAELAERPRNMGKLFKEAEKTKLVLSSNKESLTMIESLVGDYDFKGMLTRDDMEAAAAKSNYWERLLEPAKKALADAGLTIEDIDRVELVGGAWRVPKVQAILREFFGRTEANDLSKTLNGDEAFANGASLYAASLSNAFRLKKIGVFDITPFSITVDIESSEPIESDEDTDAEAAAKETKESKGLKTIKLFKKGHKIPAKRKMRFKREEDFVFSVKYDNPSELPPNTPSFIGKFNISGINAAATKYDNATKPAISVSFRLLRNGMIEVESAEATVEQTVEVQDCEKPKKKDKKTKKEESADKEADFKSFDEDEDNHITEDEFKAHSKLAPTDAVATEVEAYLVVLFADLDIDGNGRLTRLEYIKVSKPVTQILADKFEKKDAEKEGEEAKEAEKKEAEPEKPVCTTKQQKRIHRTNLVITQIDGGLQPMSESQKRASRKVLTEFEERERLQRERAQAQNDLESYIYATRDKIEGEEFKAVTSDEQRTAIDEALTKAAQWLDDEGWTAKTKELKDQLRVVKDLADPGFLRIAELDARPKAVADARVKIQGTLDLVNSTLKAKTWLNETDAQDVREKIEKAETWLNEKEEEQLKKKPYEHPAFLSSDVPRIIEPITVAFRKFERIPKPIVKSTPAPSSKSKSNDTANATTPEEPSSSNTTSSKTEKTDDADDESVEGADETKKESESEKPAETPQAEL